MAMPSNYDSFIHKRVLTYSITLPYLTDCQETV